MSKDVLYSEEFFWLNLEFARRVAEVTGLPFEAALRGYTHLYLSFGLGRTFDTSNPEWQAYIQGLKATDPLAWTYAFYRERQDNRPPRFREHAFGCFSYTFWADGRVRLHFHNAEAGNVGPLSAARQGIRREELKAMFTELRRQAVTTNVIGGSWLYNLDAYRRLFPPLFLANACVGDDDWQFIALWGQFVDRCGEVRRDMAETFVGNIAKQTSLAGLQRSFPYQVLRLESPIENFYEFYHVE